jgi:hypothetical protein
MQFNSIQFKFICVQKLNSPEANNNNNNNNTNFQNKHRMQAVKQFWLWSIEDNRHSARGVEVYQVE